MKNEILYYLNKFRILFSSQKIDVEYLHRFYNVLSNERIVVFDTETTGLDRSNDDIIQLAAIEIIRGKKGESFECYFSTEKELSPTQKIHNISNEALKAKATNKKEGLNKFLNFISNDSLLAHNIEYDYAIINSNLLRIGINSIDKKINKIFCTLLMTRQLFKLPSYKLGNILTSLKLPGENSHDAMDDSEATVNLAFHLIKEIEDRKLN
jgi:DNA helicase-2/ATP-dependent DNA helicase PcrA